MNDKKFMDELNQYLGEDNRGTCVQNSNVRAKPKSSSTKSDLMHKRVFADFLQLGSHHYGRMRRMQLALGDQTQVVSRA